MDTHQNQPQIQQTVIVVGKQKSVGVAFLLAFLFGPLGLLYASVTGGIVMFLLGIVIGIFTLGLGLILVWIGSIIWAVVAAGNANKKMTSSTGLHINTTFGGQPQPIQSTPQNYQQTPPPPVQESKPTPVVIETPTQQIIEEPKQEYQSTPTLPIPKQPSFDLSQWFEKNKKSVLVGAGGIVGLLILFVLIKFVFSLDFKKNNTSSIETPATANTQEIIQTNQSNETTSLSGASVSALKVGENFSFPIINLQDQSKSDRINSFIINAVLGEEFNSNNLKSKLEERKKEVEKSYQGLTSLSYNVVFNNPSILSLGISSCWVGNRENCDEVQYNFDLNTGYNITLDQIIKPSRKYDIKQMIVTELTKRLNESKADMIKNGDWSSDYESSIQDEIRQVQLQFEPSSFKLSDKGISFVYLSMPFAMVFRNYFPSQDYFYSWSSIKDYLNPSSPISNILFAGQPVSSEAVKETTPQNQPGNYIINGNVSNKAYFYNSPDYNTKRKAYFSTQENVYVQKFENGFGYVEFTNTNGQTSYGWIETKYLISRPN